MYHWKALELNLKNLKETYALILSVVMFKTMDLLRYLDLY